MRKGHYVVVRNRVSVFGFTDDVDKMEGGVQNTKGSEPSSFAVLAYLGRDRRMDTIPKMSTIRKRGEKVGTWM